MNTLSLHENILVNENRRKTAERAAVLQSTRAVYRNNCNNICNVNLMITKMLVFITVNLMLTYAVEHKGSITVPVKTYVDPVKTYCGSCGFYEPEFEVVLDRNSGQTKFKHLLKKVDYQLTEAVGALRHVITGVVPGSFTSSKESHYDTYYYRYFDSKHDYFPDPELDIRIFDQHDITKMGLTVRADYYPAWRYENDMTITISCEHMLRCNSTDATFCPIYQKMKYHYESSQEHLEHMKRRSHFRDEYTEKPKCHHGGNCSRLLRIWEGADTISDRCHAELYTHPTQRFLTIPVVFADKMIMKSDMNYTIRVELDTHRGEFSLSHLIRKAKAIVRSKYAESEVSFGKYGQCTLYADTCYETGHHSDENRLDFNVNPVAPDSELDLRRFRQLSKKGIEVQVASVRYIVQPDCVEITCKWMNDANSSEAEYCPTYCSMKYYGEHTQEQLDHMEWCNHFRSLEHKPSCRDKDLCKHFSNVEQGGNALVDRCHLKLYRHPPRSRLLELSENVNAMVWSDKTDDIFDITRPHRNPGLGRGHAPCEEEGFGYNDNWLDKLQAEVRGNGFVCDLWTKDGTSILEIVDEKMKHPRHQLMQFPLEPAEMLSLILYTGLHQLLSLTMTSHYVFQAANATLNCVKRREREITGHGNGLILVCTAQFGSFPTEKSSTLLYFLRSTKSD